MSPHTPLPSPETQRPTHCRIEEDASPRSALGNRVEREHRGPKPAKSFHLPISSDLVLCLACHSDVSTDMRYIVFSVPFATRTVQYREELRVDESSDAQAHGLCWRGCRVTQSFPGKTHRISSKGDQGILRQV